MIGRFVQSNRLSQNRSQEQVSNAAGISRSTLSLLERGEKVRIDSLIQVLRVLDLLHVFEAFEIKDQISPIEYARIKKKQRQKASPKKDDTKNEKDLGW